MSLPRYTSKPVHIQAFLIESIEPIAFGSKLRVSGQGYQHVLPVSGQDYQHVLPVGRTHGALAGLLGGYLLIHPDGHASWSPAAVFESNYTLDCPASMD